MFESMKLANHAKMSLPESTKPLLVVSRLVGMNPKSHWHKIYTVFILVCDILIIDYIWEYYGRLPTKNFNFKILVHSLEDVCRLTSLLVVLVPGLFGQNRFMIPLNHFARVDRGLRSLSVCVDNRCIYRFQILLVAYVGLITLFYWVMKFSFYVLFPMSDARRFRVMVSSWPHYLTVTVVSAVADCLFLSTLSIIRNRFEEINSIIHRACNHGSYLRINFLEACRATRTDNHVLKDLRILRKQYHDLWGIANRFRMRFLRTVNETYGLHLLTGSTSSLALITSNLWQSYYVFMSPERRMSHGTQVTIEGVIWAFFYITRMLFLVKTTESTIAAAKGASIMLQELQMKGDHDRATKNEIRNFLTQLQLEVPKFTACGFFDIDFTLICGILGAASTYLVILIQMDK